MKAAPISNRPGFDLMKQTDIQSFYHLQMPRWLFFDKKYMPLSLEAKVVYTFLLNRFQLSKLNKWINEDGEVFIIYTRESLAEEIQISYRSVIGCMKELAAMKLIWERRCGRGDANQIYLAQVELTNESASVYESAPFVSPGSEAAASRPAKTACLDAACVTEALHEQDKYEQLRSVESAHQDVQNLHIKNCENGTLRPAESACQDLQYPHTSYIDINYTEKNDTEISQSVSREHTRAREAPTRRTDDEIAELDEILERCELWTFPPATARVFENAIERLYFSEQYRIAGSVLPQRKVRSHLHELDQIKLQTAEQKIVRNTEIEIRNTTAYTMAVIFNAIWEAESDLMNDPYLNSLRADPPPGTPDGRDDS